MCIVRRKVCINFDTKVNKQKLPINFLDAQKSSAINLYLILRQQRCKLFDLTIKVVDCLQLVKNKLNSVFIENMLQ